MWILIECEDPATGPGHDEKRRIIFPKQTAMIIDRTNQGLIAIPANGAEMHPCTPGEDGYHCQICHKDIPGQPRINHQGEPKK